MKVYISIAILLAIICIGIGHEMKNVRVNKDSKKSSPNGFIVIEMDHDSGNSNSGWGDSWSNDGWGSGGGKMMQMPRFTIKINKKISLPPMGMMLQRGWSDSSEESSDGWSGGSGGSNGYSGGSSSYSSDDSGYSGGDNYDGWSGWSGSSNGYDGNSGYDSNSGYNAYRRRS